MSVTVGIDQGKREDSDWVPTHAPVSPNSHQDIASARDRGTTAWLKMDSERGILGDERLVVVAIAIIDARVGFSD